MTTKLDAALDLAKSGFHVFPLEVGTKLPHIDDYPNKATRDAAQIRRWWTCPITDFPQDFNIAISTTRYLDDAALLVVDVDNKGGKRGDLTIEDLAREGSVLPDTLEAGTPTGGRHLFYRVPAAVRQGAQVLGVGVDTRSRGGYVVAAGSRVDAGDYRWLHDRPVSPAPDWLVERCGLDSGKDRAPAAEAPAVDIDPVRAEKRAIEYLAALEPATEGARNHRGFATAAKLKDFGVTETRARELMQTNWKCTPPLDFGELKHVVRSAYRYGRDAFGSAAPEVEFDPAPGTDTPPEAHPFDKLNSEFAFVIAGGGHHILWETKDEIGKPKLEHLSESAFHKRHASQTIQVGKRSRPVTEEWMVHPRRRSYDGLVFMPGEAAPASFYNLWRGFSVKPTPPGVEHPAVGMFFDHVLQNICGNNQGLFHWLIGYLAHMVQRPFEKPLVALVFRGSKGVGKSAMIERVGALLGPHFLSTSNRRYLVGNFNGHLENCLLFVLEEAFWSGDKQAEGVLKDLITGARHVIEHKGKEHFTVANKTRVVIIGNESWLVPASHDERRFAVFDVGEGRKQDRNYFIQMREGMERGGYRVLLRRLLDYPLAGLDFNEAPQTPALLEQKHASLEPVTQWWLECLTDGSIVGGDFDGWPGVAEIARVRNALRRYFQDHNIRSRVPTDITFGKALKTCAPSIQRDRLRVDGPLVYVYRLPPLDKVREDWVKYIGHPVEWGAK